MMMEMMATPQTLTRAASMGTHYNRNPKRFFFFLAVVGARGGMRGNTCNTGPQIRNVPHGDRFPRNTGAAGCESNLWLLWLLWLLFVVVEVF